MRSENSELFMIHSGKADIGCFSEVPCEITLPVYFGAFVIIYCNANYIP